MESNELIQTLNKKYEDFANFLIESKKLNDTTFIWVYGNSTPDKSNDESASNTQESKGNEVPKEEPETKPKDEDNKEDKDESKKEDEEKKQEEDNKDNDLKKDEKNDFDEEDEEENKEEVKKNNVYTLYLYTNCKEELIMHWCVGKKALENWDMPDKNFLPENSKILTDAIQTSFIKDSEYPELKSIKFVFPAETLGVKAINFVVFQPEGNVWYNNYGVNYQIKFPEAINTSKKSKDSIPNFAKNVIQCEGSDCSWSLMHRYNTCIGTVQSVDLTNMENIAWIYVWLRYSGTKQLTTQRSFNTPPKDLSWSQVCLDRKSVV